MVLDVTWLGYGAGLVMTGWVCGMIISSIFGIFDRLPRK